MRRHKRGISEGSLRRECVRREKKRTSEGEWQEKGSGEENGDRNKEDGGAGGAGGGGAERRGRRMSEERRKQKRGNFGKGLKPKPFCREGQNFQVYI